jgi:hypothetical protein
MSKRLSGFQELDRIPDMSGDPTCICVLMNSAKVFTCGHPTLRLDDQWYAAIDGSTRWPPIGCGVRKRRVGFTNL